MMHSEYLPMLANSVTKNPAAKDLATRLASGRGTDERFAHKNSRADMPGHVSSSNDKFEAYGARTQARFGRATRTDIQSSNYLEAFIGGSGSSELRLPNAVTQAQPIRKTKTSINDSCMPGKGGYSGRNEQLYIPQ